MKVSILTLGCRVNQSESNVIEGSLHNNGWSIVDLSGHPDYCIVNTCTVTAKSDYQSRQFIRRAVRTGAKVIVTGCYAQLRPEEIKNITGVDVIIGNNEKYSIINMLLNKSESFTYDYSCRSRPYLKVQDGCNLSCTYCTVPMARGRSRSLEVREVIRRAQELENAGYKEIVLTGIHLGSYGHDLNPKTKLSKLLKTLLKETIFCRIRLSSLEIKELNNELIELLREKRICKHLHLPLQSGSDTILKLMNRMYTSKEYELTIENIIKCVPDIAIGTDVIVGFPGEGEKEFLKTKQLLASIPISYMHIFPFSPRSNTLASKMGMQNTPFFKKKRLNDLKSLSAKKKMDYMSSQVHKTLDVIIEDKSDDNTVIGTSSNYLKVKVPYNGYPKGTLIRVMSSDIEGEFIRAELMEKL